MFGLIGILASVIYIFISYVLDTSIKIEQDIEDYTGLNVIGTMPKSNEKEELIVNANVKSTISEAFKTIRTNIEFTNGNKISKSILFTSCNSGEGKSWITSNIAVAYAQANKNVIIVDSDMRKGRQHQVFSVDNKLGLSNCLNELEENNYKILEKYIKETKIPKVHIITIGAVPPNPSELLLSSKMEQLIKMLKNIYDIVIIDGTPCNLVSDSIPVSSIVDETIIVTESKKTKIEDLKHIVKLIKNANGNIIGAILNKKELKRKEYGKGYYYGNIENIEEKINIEPKTVSELIENRREEIEEKHEEKNISENDTRLETLSKRIEDLEDLLLEIPDLTLNNYNKIVEEVKKVYEPVELKMENEKLKVTNRNHHIDLSSYRCLWTVSIDGKQKEQGEFTLPEIAPGESGTIDLPTFRSLKDIYSLSDCQLKVSIVLKSDALWAKAGHEVTWEQFCLQKGDLASADLINKGTLQVEEDDKSLLISGRGFSVQWEKKVNGSMTSLIYKNKEMLAHSDDFPVQPVTQVFRAPTDNDKSFGNWLAKDWKLHGMDHPQINLESFHHEKRADGAVIVRIQTSNLYKEGKVVTTSVYTVFSDGTIDLKTTFLPQGVLPEIPRLGIAFCLAPAYDTFTWYGRGPQDNYPDRKTSAMIGLWKGSVAEQYVHYPRPQDSGNKEEVHYLTLTDKQNKGIRVDAVENAFSASALHYTVQDIYEETHDCNLKPRAEIILSMDAAVLGLGNSSCGPGVLKKYAIEKKEHTLHIRISSKQ